MKKVGFIGWRGLVGSALIQRIVEEGDMLNIYPVFFTSSQYGDLAPDYGQYEKFLQNAFDFNQLRSLDIIVSCQGNDYTKRVHPKLRKIGWSGYWLDSASFLRMKKDSVIVLDPVNYFFIKKSIFRGFKDFICGNCIANLMLISLYGLFNEDLIDWVSYSTYQAVSGAGSDQFYKLLIQIKELNCYFKNKPISSFKNILFLEKDINQFIKNNSYFSSSLVFNLVPWIDKKMNNGQTREEWKIQEEINKILNFKRFIFIDGICVRINSLRCHSQSLIVKLKKDISIKEINNLLLYDKDIINIIPNDPFLISKKLNPVYVSGKLKVFIGKIRKLNIGKKYLSIFSVGDQLLWGAAEPIRRVLSFLCKF